VIITARIAFFLIFFIIHVADNVAVYSVSNSTEAQFMVLEWGDEVEYGLSYRSVRLHRPADRYDQPYAIVDFIPQ
jgi:hypothetical protein